MLTMTMKMMAGALALNDDGSETCVQHGDSDDHDDDDEEYDDYDDDYDDDDDGDDDEDDHDDGDDYGDCRDNDDDEQGGVETARADNGDDRHDMMIVVTDDVHWMLLRWTSHRENATTTMVATTRIAVIGLSFSSSQGLRSPLFFVYANCAISRPSCLTGLPDLEPLGGKQGSPTRIRGPNS